MEIRLNSNVLQRCVNMNQCGWDFILITQSTVELPSALQKGKKRKRGFGASLQFDCQKKERGNNTFGFGGHGTVSSARVRSSCKTKCEHPSSESWSNILKYTNEKCFILPRP